MRNLPGRTQVPLWFGTWAVLAAFGIYAVAGLAASLLPASVIAGRVAQFSGAEATAQVATAYAGLVARARETSVVLLAAWVLLLWRRRWLAGVLARVSAAARPAVAAVPRRARTAVQRAWSEHRAETLVFVLLLLSGVAFRLAYLDRDLRHDEAWTYLDYARRPAYLSPLLLTDVNHHPLNTILIQAFTAVFGDGVPVIRLPAFLFGVGCIPAAFALARGLGGRRAGLLAAALVAGWTPLVEYSVNARGYSAVSFFALLLLWAGCNALRCGGASTWPLAAVAAVLGAYANIVMLLPCVVGFVWFGLLAVGQPPGQRWVALRRTITAGSAAVLGVVLLYLPFLVVSGWSAISGSQGIKAKSGIGAAFVTLPDFLARLAENWDRDVGPLPAAVLALLALASPFLARRHGRDRGLLLVGIGAAVLFQFAVVRDSGPERIWLPLLSPLLVLAATAVDDICARLRPGLAAPATAALLLLAGLVGAAVRSGTLLSSIETGYFPPAREVAGIMDGLDANDLLAITAVRAEDVRYYAERRGVALRVVHTLTSLRILRPVNGHPDAGPGRLVLVVDKRLRFCTIEQCVREAQAAIRTTGGPTLVRDTPEYAELVLSRAP